MVRNYKRKTERTNINEDAFTSAISEVIEGKLSIRRAADKYNVKCGTLQHRIKKWKEGRKEEGASYSSKYTSQQVFNLNQEKLLTEYIIKCSKMHHGLTLSQVRHLAYQYAKQLGVHYPKSWDSNQSAGHDWISSFRKRNPNISLRKPENTSVARSFSFNKASVATFFENLEEVMTKYNFSPDRIINFDETGITTVLSTPKILAEKNQRQVGQIVSAERGELVTFGGIITGIGNTIPPVFVFPRVHYKNHFLNGAPEGSLGLSSRSGWINSNLFLEVLKHIQKHSNSTIEKPILLICDNHESHVSIEAINFCRESGIVYLSFPPHTSHRLQPLDVGVFGPFKTKLKTAFNDWHINHPGKALTIYDIPRLAKIAYFESFTAKNISSAFAKPGIVPFNALAFTDSDFAPCEVFVSQEVDEVAEEHSTNPESLSLQEIGHKEISSKEESIPLETLAIPSSSRPMEGISNKWLSPEAVRPFPRIKQESRIKKLREKGKSRIYTKTPEKNRLEELRKIKDQKNVQKQIRQRAKELKTAQNLLGIFGRPRAKASKPIARKSSSIGKERRDSGDSDSDSSDKSINIAPILPRDVKEGDFVVTKLISEGKNQPVKHFVAKILAKCEDDEGNDFQVSFLKRKPSGTFIFPEKKDEAFVSISDIVLKLPDPVVSKGTYRTTSLYSFKADLYKYNIPL